MSLLEVIEALCEVTQLQADIILKQTEALEQAKIADSVAKELLEMRGTAAEKLQAIQKYT